jgi:hypothetical protein
MAYDKPRVNQVMVALASIKGGKEIGTPIDSMVAPRLWRITPNAYPSDE